LLANASEKQINLRRSKELGLTTKPLFSRSSTAYYKKRKTLCTYVELVRYTSDSSGFVFFLVGWFYF